MTVGFLGLGWMGSNFARRLAAAGFEVIGYDPNPEKLRAAAESGVKPAGSAWEAASAGGAVMTSLPDSDVFARVAEETLLPAAAAGRVFVDTGTTELSVTRRVARELEARGAALVDAPVSGDPRQGVHVFVGGPEPAVRSVWSLLATLAGDKPCVHAGPGGCGQILKGVNQLAMGLVQAAWLETISYGVRLGTDARIIAEAVGGPDGWRATLAQNARQAAEGDPDVHDLKFAEWSCFLGAAHDAGMKMPMLEALHAFLKDRPRSRKDAMNRPYAPFWSALMETARPADNPGR